MGIGSFLSITFTMCDWYFIFLILLYIDSPKHAEKWEFDKEEEWQTRIRELGSSKWSKDLGEEDKKLEDVGKNINALSGLMHAYNKGGKSVHWGDQVYNIFIYFCFSKGNAVSKLC